MYELRELWGKAVIFSNNMMVQYISQASEWLGTDEADEAFCTFAATHPHINMSGLLAEHEASRTMRQRAAQANAGEHCYIRFGTLPKSGHSRNHITGEAEAGVSVYPASKVGANEYIVDMRGIDAGSGLFILQNRQPYIVTGDVVGKGSDGEPLLINVKARKLSKYSIKVVC